MICDKKVTKAVREFGFENEEKIIALICWLDLEDDYDLGDIDDEDYITINGDCYTVLDQEDMDQRIDDGNCLIIEGVKSQIPDHLEEYFNEDAYICDKGFDETTLFDVWEWENFDIDGVNYGFYIISDEY